MRVRDLDYDLPEERVAQRPPPERDGGRLLVIRRGELEHDRVRSLARHVPAGALVVVNDTRVLPARLLGARRGTGGRAEVLLVRERRSAPDGARATWVAMMRASKALRCGSFVDLEGLSVEVVGREGALFEVELRSTLGPVREAIGRLGHVPLPPYIRRADDAADRERYQTIFAAREGAVAAPTAGLHLSATLMGELERTCEVARLTLHVGLGTFAQVTVDDLDRHAMHEEAYDIPAATADAVARARRDGRPIVAIGTTVLRALESAKDGAGGVSAGAATTRLLVQPGYRFGVVDLLFTNFHLPRSTLLALACAFGGTARVLAAYRAAIAANYMFFSYGDATLLERDAP